MTNIANSALVAACEQLLTENIAYTTLDCQAAVEEALRRAGVPLSECNQSGSNAHYRKCLWRGTPERMIDLIGAKEVPAGMFVFIVEGVSNGTPAKYRADGYGDATHMGVYLGNGRTFNSSEKMGGVVVSTKFNGKKQAVSGSWNMVGWSPWIDCGLTAAQTAALMGDANYTGGGTDAAASTTTVSMPDQNAIPLGAPIDVTGYYTVKSGCEGGAVERLQSWLVDLGYSLAIDHDFGPATDNAVRYFQKTNGLEADGIVGPKTWAALAQARKAAINA